MTKLHLKYVQAFRSGGDVYYYFRRHGQTRVRLPGLPGSAEFMAAYQAALATAPVALSPGVCADRCHSSPMPIAAIRSNATNAATGTPLDCGLVVPAAVRSCRLSFDISSRSVASAPTSHCKSCRSRLALMLPRAVRSSS